MNYHAKMRFLALAVIVVFCLAASGGCTRKQSSQSKKSKKAVSKDKKAQDEKLLKRRELLEKVRFWAYQIQKQDWDDNIDKLADSHYDLLVIDQTRSLQGDEDYDSKEDVAYLKDSANSRGGKKLVVCYVDVGEAESYRWYWEEEWEVGDPDWILAEDPDGWDENYPVKFWDEEWKDIMKETIDRIIEDGYDGIYLDWLEIYSFEPVDEAAEDEDLDPVEELTVFVTELSQHAHAKDPDFLFIAQNAAELGTFPEYTKLFDAIAQEAVWYDGTGDPDTSKQHGDEPWDPDESRELAYQLEEWQNQGIPVFNAEYAQESDNVKRAYKLGKENDFITYVTLRPLEQLTATTPPDY